MLTSWGSAEGEIPLLTTLGAGRVGGLDTDLERRTAGGTADIISKEATTTGRGCVLAIRLADAAPMPRA